MEKKLKYTEAIQELEAIVAEMENEEISVDVLAEKVKRASFLIKFCREKLTKTEEDVNQVLGDLESGPNKTQSGTDT